MRVYLCTVDSGAQVTVVGQQFPDRNPVTSVLRMDRSDVRSCDIGVQLCQCQACVGNLWAVVSSVSTMGCTLELPPWYVRAPSLRVCCISNLDICRNFLTGPGDVVSTLTRLV